MSLVLFDVGSNRRSDVVIKKTELRKRREQQTMTPKRPTSINSYVPHMCIHRQKIEHIYVFFTYTNCVRRSATEH